MIALVMVALVQPECLPEPRESQKPCEVFLFGVPNPGQFGWVSGVGRWEDAGPDVLWQLQSGKEAFFKRVQVLQLLHPGRIGNVAEMSRRYERCVNVYHAYSQAASFYLNDQIAEKSELCSQWLGKLRALLGDEDYYSGRLPDLDWLREVKYLIDNPIP